MRVNDTQWIFSGDNELGDQSVPFAKLNLLLREFAEVCEGFFPSPTLLEAAKQQMVVRIQADLAAPFRQQQVFLVARRVAF